MDKKFTAKVEIGFNAARGFVGGAAVKNLLKDFVNFEFQCRTRLCGWCSKSGAEQEEKDRGFNAARGFVGGAALFLIVR